MRTRLFALLATVLLAAGVSLVGATPALAAEGGTCSLNAFCLYQWKSYGAQVANDRWQTTLSNIYNHPGHCLSIPPATWANGTSVADNSGSMQWRIDPAAWAGYTVAYYNWTACNEGGGAIFFGMTNWDTSASDPDLSVGRYPQNGLSIYHTITSVAVIEDGPFPG